MALWPKLTSMFNSYIENVKRAQPRHFRSHGSNTDPYHSVSSKYVNFVGGVYKIAEMLDN